MEFIVLEEKLEGRRIEILSLFHTEAATEVAGVRAISSAVTTSYSMARVAASESVSNAAERASPKSVSFTSPFHEIRMFGGEMSRCTILRSVPWSSRSSSTGRPALLRRRTASSARTMETSIAESLERDAAMDTLKIAGGRKQKMRPTDILGALTGEAGGLQGSDIGKIEIHENFSYVAVAKQVSRLAQKSLSNGRIKGKRFVVTLLK